MEHTRTHDSTDQLQALITCSEDAYLGYRDASEGTHDAALQADFQQQSAERLQFRQQLCAIDPTVDTDVDGSWQGKVHRGWINMKEGMNVSDDEIIKDILTGEKQALDKYEEVLGKEELDPRLRDLARMQREAIAAQRARLETRID